MAGTGIFLRVILRRETIFHCARELHEETRIEHPLVIPRFKQEIGYFFRSPRHGLIQKTVVFFLGKINARKVILSKEHVGFAFLTYEQAMKQLTFPSARQILQAAWNRLQLPLDDG